MLLGKYEDAVMLFVLCGDNDRVIQIFNTLLSRVVAIPTTPGPANSNRVERDRVISLVTKYAGSGILQSQQKQTQSQSQSPLFQNVKDRRLTSTFEQLLQLAYFFDLYHTGRLIDALQVFHSPLLILLAHGKPSNTTRKYFRSRKESRKFQNS